MIVENEQILEHGALFSPAALMATFANSIASPLLNGPVKFKGIYRKGKGVRYNGVFYDVLKDEYSDSNITLVVPEPIRNSLNENHIIEGLGFLTKRITQATSRIDLLLNISEMQSIKKKEVDAKEIEIIRVLQEKAQKGYKDVEGILRGKLYRNEKITITVIVGQTAIIDADIRRQLKNAASFYSMEFVRANLTKVDELISAMRKFDGVDFLVIARGGGENMHVFDDLKISTTALILNSPLVTAIGHAADEPLLQKVADKSFITPTAFGQFLYDVAESVVTDISNSKTKMITDITSQIELQYKQTVQNLTFQLTEVKQNLVAEKEQMGRTSAIRDDQLHTLRRTNYILLGILVLFIICVVVILSR